jgi:dihydroflavonol-4-reductase
MDELYIVTGADGHLGTALILELEKQGAFVRALIEPNHPLPANTDKVTYYHGDITNKDSLRPVFDGLKDYKAYVVHCASMIDIQSWSVTDRLKKINVDGTKNMFELFEEYKCARFLYVSSVDAFKAEKKLVNEDSPLVSDYEHSGGYAATKSLATQYIKEQQEAGKDAVIVYPSAIMGPNDLGRNHIVQMVKDYMNKKIPGVIPGGYDIVDVRDVAKGILAALYLAPKGLEASYILCGHESSLKDILEMTKKMNGGKGKKVLVFPMWLAHLGLPFVALHCKIHHMRPLYTKFALHVVSCANTFTSAKAEKEIGYSKIPLEETIKDTIEFLKEGK